MDLRRALSLMLLIGLISFVLVPTVTSDDSLTNLEIKVAPTSIQMLSGESAQLEVKIIIIHSRCPLQIDDTEIILPDILVISEETEWESPEDDIFIKTLTLEAVEEGSGYISIVRDCPRYGLLEKKVPVLVGEGVLPGMVDEGPPEFVWSQIKDMKLTEIAQYYGLDVADVMSSLGIKGAEELTGQDIKKSYGISNDQLQSTLEQLFDENYKIESSRKTIDHELFIKDYVFMLLLLVSFFLFILKKYQARYLTLLIALLYFGFYKEGCMCHIGAIGNLFLSEIDIIKLHWIVLVFVPVIFSLLFGRVFCGWVCFFGTVQEFIYELRKKAFPKMKHYEVPRSLHLLKFLVLFAVVYYAHAFSRQVFCDYDPFLYIFTLDFGLGIVGILTILLLISSFFIERPFCKLFCPLGALLWITEKIPLFRVKVDKKNCISCGLCNKVCPMNKDIPNDKGECICCGKCIDRCKKGFVKYRFL